MPYHEHQRPEQDEEDDHGHNGAASKAVAHVGHDIIAARRAHSLEGPVHTHDRTHTHTHAHHSNSDA